MTKGSGKISKSPRLDRLLSNLGYGSRRDIQKLIKLGEVTLDGMPFEAPDQHIELTDDLPSRMRIYDEPLDPLPGMVLMLHKPLGVSCSHKERGDLVYDLFPERWRDRTPPLSTVGRLDKETTGLLLLTDDGDFLHRVIAPKSHVTKRYLVKVATSFRGHEAELFGSGDFLLDGEDKPLLPVLFEKRSDTEASLILTEGRYHQIRRMFAMIGNDVIALHRDRVGQLDLPDDLAAGEYRPLKAADLDALFAA